VKRPPRKTRQRNCGQRHHGHKHKRQPQEGPPPPGPAPRSGTRVLRFWLTGL
jgi:hypothetical protein